MLLFSTLFIKCSPFIHSTAPPDILLEGQRDITAQ